MSNELTQNDVQTLLRTLDNPDDPDECEPLTRRARANDDAHNSISPSVGRSTARDVSTRTIPADCASIAARTAILSLGMIGGATPSAAE